MRAGSTFARRAILGRALRRRWLAVLLALTALAVLGAPAATLHLRAADLLLRFTGTDRPPAALEEHAVLTRDLASIAGAGSARARLYVPAGKVHPPGLVLVHGVHHLGIDEPRLVRLARAIAAVGVEVLTPELAELCDYRVDPASIPTIGVAARVLARELGVPRVGVMAFSFAGGLSIIAAGDPAWSDAFSAVVAVGVHDDLGRVLRFFVTNEAPRPSGPPLALRAHPYGPAVLVYSHVADFFPPDDVGLAGDVLRLWLHEDFEAARALARGLSPAGAEVMAHFFDRDTGPLGPALAAEIEKLSPSFAAVSPSAHIAGLRVPLYLLHGADDTVIPPTETEWLAHDAPPARLREVLVSRAIGHVELGAKPRVVDELLLVHFMASVLGAVR
ncbi:MAG: hypothetical protein JOZ69_07010 [Myxococcales bacterium]|nr:hypothetical protein [Myxococcales bacterium]